MSNYNILKGWCTPTVDNGSRMINNNTRIDQMFREQERKRREQEALLEKMKKNEELSEKLDFNLIEDGFVPGLQVKHIETFEDEYGNVVYQSEEDTISSQQTENSGLYPLQDPFSEHMAEKLRSDQEQLEKEKAMLEAKKQQWEAKEQEMMERIAALEQQELEAKKRADDMIEQAQITVDQITEEARENGRTQGYAEGFAKAEQYLEEQKKLMEQRREELEKEYLEKIRKIEPDLVAVITDLYQTIFDVDFMKYMKLIPNAIEKTLKRADGIKNCMIHVSKEDYPYVNMNKKQLIAAAKGENQIEVVEDLTLKQNECLIETEGGIYDCSIGTQLAELEKQLKIMSYPQKE